MNSPGVTAVVVLAAGGSTRLGEAKQLVSFHEEPLIVHAVRAALGAGVGPVTVVVGAREREVSAVLASMRVEVLVHETWERGLGSSIAGATGALASRPIGGIVFLLCDQPGLTASHLAALARGATPACPIVASRYADVLGVPAYFGRAIFPELALLDGAAGARSIIAHDPERVLAVPFPAGVLDVDTPADLALLRALERGQLPPLSQN